MRAAISCLPFGFCAVLLALISTAQAGAQDARLVAATPGTTPSTEAVQARVGAPVRILAALREHGTWHCDAPRIRIDGRLQDCAPWPDGAQVRWIQVEARMQHQDLPAPNPGLSSFSNAVLTGPDHGRWLGFDTLEYAEVDVRADDVERDVGLVVRVARPSDARRDVHAGAGTMFMSAQITLADGRVLRTPGAADTDRYGLARSVMRVSFREADDEIGWLSTYFLVPNVFGSSGPGRDHQSDRYVGADCADVLVGALRAMGRPLPYVSVAGLSRIADPVSNVFLQDAHSGLLDSDGAPVRLQWGRDVQRGDYVTLDYADPTDRTLLPRAWDHIGALVGDSNGNGVLDGADLLRHMGHGGLRDEALVGQGHARIRLHRLRPARRRAR